MKRSIIISLMAMCALGVSVLIVFFLVNCARRVAIAETIDTMNVIIPAGRGKCPVVFLAHNGNQTREDWGDFPEYLADKGYAVINMGWSNFQGGDDFRKNYDAIVKKYGKTLDLKRVAFVGGCHGGIKMLASLEWKLPFTPKALVFLSMSELYTPAVKHAPILGIYSLRDHLGAGYIATQKKLYETLFTEPKKILALDVTPHGDELVTDSSTKDQVRAEVVAWLEKLL